MALRYYSDVTHQFYDNEKACLEAEFKVKEEQNKEKILKERKERERKEKEERLSAERKARAAEVEEARKAMTAAQTKYKDLLEAFVRDYKSYHYSTKDVKEIPTLFDIFSFPFLNF